MNTLRSPLKFNNVLAMYREFDYLNTIIEDPRINNPALLLGLQRIDSDYNELLRSRLRDLIELNNNDLNNLFGKLVGSKIITKKKQIQLQSQLSD